MARRQLLVSFALTGFAILGSVAPTWGDAFNRERSQLSVYGFVNDAHSRWAGGKGHGMSYGSAVAISPWHVITCGHCLRDRSAPYFIFRDGATIHCAVLERRDDDTGASVLVTDAPLENFLPLGEPREGWAMAVTLDGQHNIRLEAPPSRRFTGWRPYRGSSGSPVIQDGRVVGLVQKQSPAHNDMWSPHFMWEPCTSSCKPPQWGEYSPIGAADLGRTRGLGK